MSNRIRPSSPRALILGNGPSVDRMPPDFWAWIRDEHAASGLMIVGTNRALVLSALFAHDIPLDAVVIRDTYHNLFLQPAVASAYHELWRAFDGWRVGPAEDRMTDCDEFVRQSPGWQDGALDRNGELLVMRNHSVVLSALNWAVIRGARDIALLGVDYRAHPVPFAHFRPPYDHAEIGWQGLYDGDKPVPAKIEREFAAALAAVRAAGGGTLVNLSEGSALKAIPLDC